MIGNNSPIELVSEGVEIQEINANSDFELELNSDRYHSFYMLSGDAELNGEKIVQDDFIKISDEEKARFTNKSGLRLFYISNPKELTHRTYYQSNKSRY
jgi:redox-sensitive bicupin YhaK (pirin superfamily)